MSKSIGGVLVHYPHQENVGNVNNYLTSPNLPSLTDYQTASINNPMTLAQGVRNANQTEFIDYDLAIQIKNLQTLMPNNPALQQQYSATLTKVLASRINAQAGITDPSPQPNPWANVQNSLSNDAYNIMYGASRALNGLTYGGLDYLGGKLGIDTQMNNYLQNQTAEGLRNVVQTTGNFAQYGGNLLPMLIGGTTVAGPINMAYNGYKIGKAYDRLQQNPFQGNGSDIIARMKNHQGDKVILQRGEAIPDSMGNPIVHGRALQRETGTYRNYGLDKAIYRHNILRQDAKRIPQIIRNKPVEISPRGQNIYIVKGKNGNFEVVTSPTSNGVTISSTYYLRK